MITQAELKEILNYDTESGVFTWKKRLAPRGKVGDVAGCIDVKPKKGTYLRIRIRGVLYYAHRLAWIYTFGEEPKNQIDHINGDGTDNRISNLSEVTCAENQLNKRLSSNNTSGANGVVKNGRGWVAQAEINGEHKYMGWFYEWHDAVYARYYGQITLGFTEQHGVRA